MENIVANRLSQLRQFMKKEGYDVYLLTSDDYHCSEYIADYFKTREYFTGFTGDNAMLVVTADEAKMWTDGRFFIQAEIELEGTGIELMKMGEEGVPTVREYIKSVINEKMVLAMDGETISAGYGKAFADITDKAGARFVYDSKIPDELWPERPGLPSSKIWILDDSISGENAGSKFDRLSDCLHKNECDGIFISKLDDIMWLTNLRASDIECNPVALSYFYADDEKKIIWLQKSQVTDEISEYLNGIGVRIEDYCDVIMWLKYQALGKRIMLEENSVNYTCYRAVCDRTDTFMATNPSTNMKAVKNNTEQARLKDIYLKDSVAVIKFAYWLKNNIGKTEITEISAAEYIDCLRSKIPGFIELSFPTISGYAENAAMMHYEATPQNFKKVEPKGMLLVDSGGQYESGTTDVTRTFVLGEISDEIKFHFSKVAAGMLALADARFLYGCTGRNVDILARLPLWEANIDYKCGTGHGIGYILNVHEGPHSIRWKYVPGISEAVLEAGMIMSDEPGVYIEGSHGIRTENVIMAVNDVKNSDGQFMKFEHLTFVPIDREGLDRRYLSDKDIERINKYHEEVYQKTCEYLNPDEKKWLREVTLPI